MPADIKFEDNSDEVLKELERRKSIILEALGEEAEGNAVTEINKLVYDTPESPNYVRTGFLKNSITHATKKKDGESYSVDGNGDYHKVNMSWGEDDSVVIGSALEYASYVELGTSKMAPRPFLKNAIENYKNDYKRIVEDGLK
jgi:HK97 gp10 family phage protein